MSHTITVPINANGIVFDPDMNAVVAEALAVQPFGFDDVYLYSHGWATNSERALDEYNRFSIDLAKQILLAQGNPALAKAPRTSIGVGIHWPSQVTEDPSSPLNALELLTFYTMEHRADSVGHNAVYSMLRLVLNTRSGTGRPVRFFLLGHSFGCKVLCSALNDLQVDIANGTIPVEAGTEYRVVLLEPATNNNDLEPGDIYRHVNEIQDLRMLITRSDQDKALTEWFVAAGKLANLFHSPRRALGDAGPTDATKTAFGGADSIDIVAGFQASQMTPLTHRLLVANLSPIHRDRATSGEYNGGLSGSHSDINFTEVYNMIIGFLFA